MEKDYDRELKRKKEKYYKRWFPQKTKLDKKEIPPLFNEREVWRCHIGVNIGNEIFAENSDFTRPVLVLKKYSKSTFLGAPLSTSKARSDLHAPIKADGKQGIVRLDQIRTYDAKRLTSNSPMHRVTPDQFENIKQILKDSL